MAKTKGSEVTGEIDALFGVSAPIVDVDPKARPAVRARQRKAMGKLPLSLPERKLVNALLDDDSPNLTEAAARAGMHRNTAARALKKPEVQDAFKRVLEEHGLNDSRLAEKLDTLLDAQMNMSVKGELVEVDDNRVQLEATKTLGQLLGRLGQKGGGGNESNSPQQHVHLHLEAAGVSEGTIMVLDRVLRSDRINEGLPPVEITSGEP